MPNLKGFAFRGLLKYVKETRPGMIPVVISHLPTDMQQVFAKPIMVSQLYPYEAFARLLRQIDRDLGKGDLALCPDVGDFAARQDIATVFRVMMAALSPKTIIDRSNIFWSKYSDSGKMFSVDAGDHRFATRLENFPEMDVSHCRLMLGWINRWALMCRAKDVVVEHPLCVSKGDVRCEWQGSWRD